MKPAFLILRSICLAGVFLTIARAAQPNDDYQNLEGRRLGAALLAPDRLVTNTLSSKYDKRGRLVPLAKPITESFIRMAAGDPWVEFKLPSLDLGLYSLNIIGQVVADGRTSLDRVWRPCPMEFEARDPAGALVERGRLQLKQSFLPRRMQAFHLHVNTSGDYTIRIRLTNLAQEKVEILGINLIDQLADLPDIAIKTSQNLEPGASTQLGTLTESRRRRDDGIWAGLPPVNLHLQVHSQVKRFADLAATLTNLPSTQCWQNAPYWRSGRRAANSWAVAHSFTPLDMLNTETGEVFPQARVLAGEPFPGTWPDDGTGVYLSTNDYPSLPHAIVLTPRAELLGARVVCYMGLLGAGDLGKESIAAQYAAQGNPETGHDAALALVRLAYDWPAVECVIHEIRKNIQNPDLEYGADWTGDRRNGKYFYDGWSGGNTMNFLTAYDQVFPYIKDNAVFAAAVNRFIPWINTPSDVIRFLDRWLVFASVRDVKRSLIRASPVDDLAAQVLGPHPLTAPLCDTTRQMCEIYPYEGTYRDLYATALSRSGVYHIGSFMVYGLGGAAKLVDKAAMLKAMNDQGCTLPMNLGDIERYRKVKSASDFMLDMWPAGGFAFTVGDASGGPHTPPTAAKRLVEIGPSIRKAYALTRDPRHAWIMAHLLGDTNDAIRTAAATVRNPILHAPPRVVPDWGAIMEVGVDETNLTLKSAATLRLGIAQGHAHNDYLDLNLFGLSLPVAVDLACRNEGLNWSRPGAASSALHNHAISHDTEAFGSIGGQDGEPWLSAFAPPLMRGGYTDSKGGTQLERDIVLMSVGNGPTHYVFDLQRLQGGQWHTWCFHGCESDDILLNTDMTPGSNAWTAPLLAGTQKMGVAPGTLQATWTMTRAGREFKHTVKKGGLVETLACEPAVLGESYDSNRPPVQVRATLLGHAGATVLQGNPYSQSYRYCFPFLWVQSAAKGDSLYPAVYEWYRGNTPTIAHTELLNRSPLQVRVTTTSGQQDDYQVTASNMTVVSREPGGTLRFAQLNGGSMLETEGVHIRTEQDGYSARIIGIDYLKRKIVFDAPLPANAPVSIGNSDRLTWLDLQGPAGTEFSYEGDLLVHQGTVTNVQMTRDGQLTWGAQPELFHVNMGNRKLAGFTQCTEDLTWQFRNGRPIRQPKDGVLSAKVFTDTNKDGVAQVKTYEIGIGDSARVPADVRLRRTHASYEVLTNVRTVITLAGHSVTLAASPLWQEVRFP